MTKIDVCLETVFTSLPVEARLERIAQAGYTAVELWHKECTWNGRDLTGPAKDAKKLKAILDKYGLIVNNMVLNAWDATLGGSLVNPEDQKLYLKNLEEVIKFARSIGCNKLITCTGKKLPEKSYKEQRDSIISTLSEAAKIVRKEDFTLLLEPLNTYVDHPGYFLDSTKEGAKIIREINHPNIRLLYDIYHMQIMEGNVISTIEQNIDIIGHFHAAGAPGRHELYFGELNYPNIIKRIKELGYEGYFGLEYFPSMDSEESLKTIKELLEKGGVR